MQGAEAALVPPSCSPHWDAGKAPWLSGLCTPQGWRTKVSRKSEKKNVASDQTQPEKERVPEVGAGQVTQEKYRDIVQALRGGLRETKAHLRLNLVGNVKAHRKGCHK